MGGQETLLLVALHPQLLAGAAAFDPATDLRRRYYDFAALKGGRTPAAAGARGGGRDAGSGAARVCTPQP